MRRFRIPSPVRQSQNGHLAYARRLFAADGTIIYARHVSPGRTASSTVAFVVVHGFTQSGSQAGTKKVVQWLRRRGGVISVDMRGHGRSAGHTTLGDREILDVAAAVQWARTLGYRAVVSAGFSMGAAVVLRHAALLGGVDAVAAISSPGQWFYRGTATMRTLHRLVLTRGGRALLRVARGVRVSPTPWEPPYPVDPRAAAARIGVPLLIVHGRDDHYFPPHHGWGIHAANEASELWLEEGLGHAEGGLTADVADRIADWLVRAVEEVRQDGDYGTGNAEVLGGVEGGGRAATGRHRGDDAG